MAELKALSIEHVCPIITIASLNRASYDTPINLSSFRGSSVIEYSCEVALSLEPSKHATVNGESIFDFKKYVYDTNLVHEFKTDPIKNLELNILKNRNGRLGSFDIQFDSAKMNFNQPSTKSKFKHI